MLDSSDGEAVLHFAEDRTAPWFLYRHQLPPPRMLCSGPPPPSVSPSPSFLSSAHCWQQKWYLAAGLRATFSALCCFFFLFFFFTSLRILKAGVLSCSYRLRCRYFLIASLSGTLLIPWSPSLSSLSSSSLESCALHNQPCF